MEGGNWLNETERILAETLNPDQLREEGLERIPAGEPGHVRDGLMQRLAERGAELYHPPRPPINPYVKEYAGKLGTHHVELKDPAHPELGNHLVPNDN